MNRKSKMASSAFAIAAITSASMACATTTPLSTESSTAGIRAAEAVGADKVPQAALHLQLAREELEQAKKLADTNKQPQAVSMLTRAEADAELAVMLTREHAEKNETQEALKQVKQLQQDNK